MQNGAGFLAVYLGAARAGMTMALLNPELKGQSLKHCLDQSKASDATAPPN
jgi:acyl-CoA synthetase (AMP-forming)/AMP-acid ligase II